MQTVKLGNGKKVEAYPVTAAQHLMHYLSKSHSTDALVLNIVTGYYWQGEFDTELMKESVYEAMDRCECIRLRFAQTGFITKKVVQYLADKHEMEVIEEDLSHMSWDDAHEFIKQRSHTTIDMFNGPVNEIRIIHLENDYHGIYMKLHHLAFDGYSSKVFLADILSLHLSNRKPFQSHIWTVSCWQ